jgi:hypothetical protein
MLREIQPRFLSCFSAKPLGCFAMATKKPAKKTAKKPAKKGKK